MDLTLIPLEHDGRVWGYSQTLLSLRRADDVAQAAFITLLLADARQYGEPPPTRVHAYTFRVDGMDYGPLHSDRYDDPLRALAVRYLLPYAEHPAVCGSRRNRAAWAYLAALRADDRVLLYWM